MKNQSSITIHTFQNTQQIVTVLFKEATKSSGLMITTGGLFYPNEEIAKKKGKEVTPHVKNLLHILNLPSFPILRKLANSFPKTIFIFHKTWQLDYSIRSILGQKMVANSAFLFKSLTMPEIPMINPHYFGEIKVRDKNKETIFTVIGEIRSDKRNYFELIKAAEILEKKKYDFKINIVGKGNLADIPKSLHEKIIIHGYLDFPKMYEIVEETDFILPLFDSSVEEQKVYGDEKTSGSIQLIYGFQKLPIIENFYTKLHQFNNKNSLVYNTKDLYKGMEDAILMSKEEYTKKQEELLKLSKKIYKISLKNLKEIIESHEKST